MFREVELRQDILDHEVAAVCHLVGISELDVELVAGLGHECQRNQLRVAVKLSEFAVQKYLRPLLLC